MTQSETVDRWPGRAAEVGALVPPDSSVIDLGAGAGGLRQYLPPTCRYTAADQPDFDMNRGRWPDGTYDVAVMAGVLEYARYPGAAMRHLRNLAPTAIVTYAHGTGKRDPAWVNNLSPAAFIDLAAKAGYTATVAGTWRTQYIRPQTIWLLRSSD